MKSLLKFIRTQCKVAAFLLLPLLIVSCEWMKEDYEEGLSDLNNSDKYINLKIAVSTDYYPTRAGEVPASGENGDGREAGFERENEVRGVTLVLYRSDNGINAAGSTLIDFVQYFPTTKEGSAATPDTQYGDTKECSEVTYTTGDQKMKDSKSIDITKTYHAIVIANANFEGTFIPGTTTLQQVRDYTFAYIHNGQSSTPAHQISNFVMSSENDNFTLNFSAVLNMEDDTYYYRFTTPILIERLAARIDFWTKGGTYVTKDKNNVNLPTSGYQYDAGDDWFVVTRITPFNLNSAEGGEYLIKRLTTDLSDGTKTAYLADEAATKYVVDPSMSQKTGSTFPYTYKSDLQTEVIGRYAANPSTISSNPYSRTMADMHKAVIEDDKTAGYKSHKMNSSDETGYPDFIVGYAMENTLLPTSPLANFATGIAIEGDYYPEGSNADPSKVTHYVYYTYLRHQGISSTAYTAYQASDFITNFTTISDMSLSSWVMPFGVVRNNIYRIYIDEINEKGGWLKIAIEEKPWRHVDNPEIYI